MSFSEFLAMGGYGAYVWPAFGIAAVLLLGLFVASRHRLKSREAELARLEAAGEKPKERA